MEGRKAVPDKVHAEQKRDVFGQKSLFPVQSEASDDRADTAFINGRSGIHDGRENSVCLGMFKNIHLIRKGYLGIRDYGRKQQGMGMAALIAYDPADMETQATVPGFHGPVIVTVDGETSGMPAGTGKLVKLEGINHIIINFLRNRIAIIDRYSYHKHERLGV